MRGLRAAGFGHGKHAVSSLETVIAPVIPGDVVGDRPPTWNQRRGFAAGAGPGQAPCDGVLAAQAAPDYGAVRPVAAGWPRGSRPDLRVGSGRWLTKLASRQQGASRDRRRPPDDRRAQSIIEITRVGDLRPRLSKARSQSSPVEQVPTRRRLLSPRQRTQDSRASGAQPDRFADLISTGSSGTFWCPILFPVATCAMASTTSVPSTTLPNTQ